MKHIGWCLDNIQVKMMKLPRNIDSDNDKSAAIHTIDEVEEYAQTMAQLVTHPKLRAYLKKLDKSPVGGVRLQAHEVEELLKELEHMLYLIGLYVSELREMIKKHSGAWHYKARQIIIASVHLIRKDKQNLGREYTFSQNVKSMIRMRMNQFNNKADRLAEEIDRRFGGGRGDLREEFHIELFNKHELKEIVTSEKHLAEFLK